MRSTDVTRRTDLESLIRLGRDGLAGSTLSSTMPAWPDSRFDALRVEDWDAMIDVNLRGALYGIAAALPVFAQQGKGHVINVISTAGLKIVPTMGVYAATKNALRTATEALRQEAGAKLRVTEVSPGFIDTSFADSSITDPDVKAMINQQKERLAISPNAIACHRLCHRATRGCRDWQRRCPSDRARLEQVMVCSLLRTAHHGL